jgi:thioredoxin-related protein
VAPFNLYAEEVLTPVNIIEAQNLHQEGRNAAEKRLPILIMFSMEHCPYCELIREDFLKPMLRSGDYTDKVIIREIHSDSYATVRDFNGANISVEELTHRYGASLSPTVVFLDHKGRELSKKMIGITTVYYYGGFLDDAIEASYKRMQNNFMQASNQ